MLEKLKMIAVAGWRVMHQRILDWSLGCLYIYCVLCILVCDDTSTYVSSITQPALDH